MLYKNGFYNKSWGNPRVLSIVFRKNVSAKMIFALQLISRVQNHILQGIFSGA